MPADAASAGTWSELVGELLRRGHRATFRVRGVSMSPTLRDGDRVTLEGIAYRQARPGDIVAFRRGEQLVLHRVLEVREDPECGTGFVTAGDGLLHDDGCQPAHAIVGRVVSVRRGAADWSPDAPLRSAHARARVVLGRHPRLRSALRGSRSAIRRLAPRRGGAGKAGAES